MRWIAAAVVSMACTSSLVGCSDNDHLIDQGEAGKSGDAGAGNEGGKGGAGGSAGHAGAAHAGANNAGAAGAGTAGSGTAGEGAGGASGGSPGAGAGGANGGSPGAGAGGANAGAGGASAGAGGATAGTGGTAGAAGSSAGTGGSGGAVVTIPNAPTALTSQILSGTSVKLSWTDNATDETGYNLYWSATATKPTTPNTTVAAGTNTVTVDGLTAGTAYTFWVEAYNAAGASAAITLMATPLPVPSQPTGLVVTSSATQLTLTWNDVSDDAGYRVFISTSNTQPATAAHELAKDSTTYTFPVAEIVPYTKYYVWVAAYNAVGNSAPATADGTAGTLPSAPTGVAIAGTAPTFNLSGSWTDASDNETGFNVYWSTDDTQPAAPSATVAAGTQLSTLTTVQGGQTYRFWVEAVNALGKSAAVKATASAPSTDLVWNELWLDNGNSIHLAMNDTALKFVSDGDPLTKLNVYQSAIAGTMGTPTLLDPNPYVIWNAAAQNIDLTKIHYFWAEAIKPGGSIVSLRTLSPGGAVTNLVAAPSNLSVDLTWTATPGAQGYQTFWGTGTFAQAVLNGSGTATMATVVGLNPGTAYNLWARSIGVGIGGNGFWGPAVMTTTSTTGAPLGTNLALGKAAKALTEAGGNVAANVTDGKYGTRWESAVSDPQWVYIDLGANTAANITHVKAVWEGAYSKSFQIQICDATCDDDPLVPVDMWAWQTAYAADRTLTVFPAFELLTLTTPAKGQFVRMNGLTRGTIYGHSLYELEVYSAPTP